MSSSAGAIYGVLCHRCWVDLVRLLPENTVTLSTRSKREAHSQEFPNELAVVGPNELAVVGGCLLIGRESPGSADFFPDRVVG